ncbi:GCN5 family acetyltransferase [Gordonia sp. PDNC005]|uniref:GNAT family N-acetyltransferase, cg3035/Rv0428c family n=1 Tax=Gordonia sp. PDNC005 TaxID=2811424 RepID=UPI001965C413|nr:GCN5 family acetyltransferase [Gordonia sp. PDNC005]QRY62796.1 GCN5 family acetyltransferase [Gordonia sp. PDNC005]
MSTPDPVVGDRVVVRYRLTHETPADWRDSPNPALPHSPTLSDVTGVLVAADADRFVVRRDDVEHTIPRAAITAVRTLSRRVVRNSEIRDVERALCAAAGGDHIEIDGWSLQAGGVGLRGDLAVPVGVTASSVALPEVRSWYADRGRQPRALLPDRLVRSGSIPVVDAGFDVEVLVADMAPTVDAIEFAPDRWATTLATGDRTAREAARRAGLVLHHTAHIHSV